MSKHVLSIESSMSRAKINAASAYDLIATLVPQKPLLEVYDENFEPVARANLAVEFRT